LEGALIIGDIGFWPPMNTDEHGWDWGWLAGILVSENGTRFEWQFCDFEGQLWVRRVDGGVAPVAIVFGRENIAAETSLLYACSDICVSC